MKTIIALISNPKESRLFIEHAVSMARKFNSILHLLYVENPSTYPLGAANLSGQAYEQTQLGLVNRAKQAKEQLTKYVEGLMKQVPVKVPVDVSADIGKESVILNRMAKDPNAYMVFLENQESGSAWFRNENARSIALSVSCPVWVFPRSFSFGSFDRIVYVTDYNKEDISVLKSLIRTMHPFEPQIVALHITDDLDFDSKVKQKGFLKMVKDQTSYDRIHVETLIGKEGENMASIIHNYCEVGGADLIVLLKENGGFLQKLFTKSPAEKILSHVELPVLIYSI